MALIIKTIRKYQTFLFVKNKGKTKKGISVNIQILDKQELDNFIYIGYIASKKIGNAVKRNRSKRIMRELARKVITKFGKKNSFYVLIAKKAILESSFKTLEIEIKKLIS